MLHVSSAPEMLLRLAEDASIRSVGHVSLLVASPPCVAVSAKRRATRGENRQLRAQTAVREQWSSLRAALLSQRPFLCLIEQSVGLMSHYREAYQLWNGWLHEVPYYITLAVHDPIAVHGASHRRTRLLYALIRLDCLAHPVPGRSRGSARRSSPRLCSGAARVAFLFCGRGYAAVSVAPPPKAPHESYSPPGGTALGFPCFCVVLE